MLKTETIWGTNETDFWGAACFLEGRRLPEGAGPPFSGKQKSHSAFWCERTGTWRHGRYTTSAREAWQLPAILLWKKGEMPLCSQSLFPPQEAWQNMEGGRTHRAVFPPLPQVGLEGRGLHRQACEVGGDKTWGGHQESNRLMREQDIRGQNREKLHMPGKAAMALRVDLVAEQ